jgi:hypothetical protein
MSSPKECRTKLIPDTPATQDHFSTPDTTSPHNIVARAIADLIRSDEEGGKTIGLEGGWGSGKTTIVSILCDELKQNLNHKVVLFDAWAHEGDPLRRTFLENLIERLTEGADGKKNWIDITSWEERKEIIAQRKEIKETSSEPHISRLGYSVIFLLALVPIGLAFLNSSLKDVAFTFDIFQPNSIKFIIGLLLCIAPLLVIISGLVWARKKPSASSATGGLIWAILVNKAVTRETTKTNKTANPTSVEFEAYFAELMNEALVKNDAKLERKIVLVLDNLDRINPTEALKILSTLQTFLNPRAKDSDAWHKRVWVLIPYDFEGLSQLWGKEKSENKESAKTQAQTEISRENATTQVALDATKSNDNQQLPTENVVALSFLDKSFQLRFEVPPPVLSRWRTYLENLMKEAFEDHRDRFENDPLESEELHNVYTLYAWYLRKTNRLPTPRQLKLYVNQIGVIHRQWQDQFPFSHMAYYVLLRRMGFNVVEMVRNGELPTSDVEGFIAPGAALHLSALAFNTTVAEAKQIILENPIQEDFETRNPDSLKALYQTHQDKGFWEALERMAQANWKHYSSVQLAKAAYCLYKSELFKQPLPPSAQLLANSVKRYLRKSAEAIQDWGSLDTQIAEGITSLFEIIPDPEFPNPILNTISLGVGLKAGDTYRTIDYASWTTAILLIKEKLVSRNLVQVYEEAFIGNMKKRLLVTSPFNIFEIKILLECLCELRIHDNFADEPLNFLVFNGHILHWLQGEPKLPNIVESQVDELSSSIFLLKNPQLIKPPAFENSDEGYDYLLNWITKRLGDPTPDFYFKLSRYLADFLTKHNALENLFVIHNTRPDSASFIIDCLKVAAENELTPYVFTPEIIAREWKLFSQLTKGDFNASPLDKLVKRSIEKTNFVDEICATTFNPKLARLYSSMALQGAEKNTHFPDWIISGLQSISKELWIAHIDKAVPRDLVRLLTSIPYLRNNLSLPAYRDALLEIAKETNSLQEKNKRPKITNATDAGNLISYAGSDAVQTEVRQKIFDAAIEASGELSEEFLRVFGIEISYADLLYNDVRTFSGLLTPLLTTEKSFRQDWVAKVLQAHPDLVDKHPDSESVREFRQLVRHKLMEMFSGKKVILQANETKPPTVSIPIGKDGEFWVPQIDTTSTGKGGVSDPSDARYDVDPITAAFAIQSGWFDETPDSPYSWNSSASQGKQLATNDTIMDIAILTGVMPTVDSGIDTKLS